MSKSKTYYNFSSEEIAVTSLTEALWSSAEQMRGARDVRNYKQYFFSFFFYKYISDYWKDFVNKKDAKREGQNDFFESGSGGARFVIPADTGFDALKTKRGHPRLGNEINLALKKIEHANSKKLDGVFSYLDFNDSRVLGEGRSKDLLLSSLIESFDLITFEPSKVNNDIISRCFDLLYEKFVQLEGKGGETHQTPAGIGELLAKLLQPKENESIYDPACGSGSLLIKLNQEIQKHNTDVELYGQEIIKDVHAIAKINLIVHGLDDANIAWGDSLNNPQFIHETYQDSLQRFDIVVSNPPFSTTKWWKFGHEYNRFRWGMPPANKGDYAFIQHMLASTTEGTGRVGMIVSHGVLFRTGPESAIRQRIIEDNLLDAVIGLPGNLFSYTGIPVAILLFNKSRSKTSNVLFIDATREFMQDKRKNILTSEGIDRIVSAYNAYKANPSHVSPAVKEGFSYICTIDEMSANDYNLSINRYIHFQKEEIKIDLEKLKSEVEKLDEELSNIRKAIKQNLSELGL